MFLQNGGAIMNHTFNELYLPFTLENIKFHAHNLTLDTFSIPLPGHRHGTGCYEIHYVISGYGTLQMEKNTYEITPNTLYVTGPHIYHVQIPNQENPMTEYCIYIQKESAPGTSSSRIAKGSFLEKFLETPQWFGQDSQELLYIFEKIFKELTLQYTGYRVEVTALLQQLLIHIIRNYEYKKETEKQFTSSVPSDSMSLITDQCFLFEYAEISLQDLAKRLGISPRQTERFLKKEYGETFQQKKNHARMEAAVSFLRNPSLSITRIAGQLGYSSVEHFSHAFRNYYGVSPRKYRKNML